MSGVSTIETDQRFSGREDFWIIAAARSEDETEIRAGKAAGGRRDRDIRRATRRHFSTEEKIRIVLEVDVYHLVPHGDRHFGDPACHIDASVINEDVRRSELGRRALTRYNVH